jgi:hypothetical protein
MAIVEPVWRSKIPQQPDRFTGPKANFSLHRHGKFSATVFITFKIQHLSAECLVERDLLLVPWGCLSSNPQGSRCVPGHRSTVAY